MVRGIRDAEAALGDGRKDGPSPEELEENYTLGRRSLIATRDLPAGTVLEPDMVTVKRPGLRDRAQAPRARDRAARCARTSRPTTCSPGTWSERRAC